MTITSIYLVVSVERAVFSGELIQYKKLHCTKVTVWRAINVESSKHNQFEDWEGQVVMVNQEDYSTVTLKLYACYSLWRNCYNMVMVYARWSHPSYSKHNVWTVSTVIWWQNEFLWIFSLRFLKKQYMCRNRTTVQDLQILISRFIRAIFANISPIVIQDF